MTDTSIVVRVASPLDALARKRETNGTFTKALRDTFRLPAADTSVAVARHLVVNRLREWEVAADSREDAELMVSELFTNAVRHTDSESVSCELWVIGRRLRVEVADEGSVLPCIPIPRQSPCEGDEGGRGLMLVSLMAEEWGVRAREQGQGHAVWAELSCRRGLD
ncbi:ATP-binding protein [Streptomyces sp. NPDC005438]|uniref:ATP-binding protein n=1 Tax=Streptomyces sp. NPDC005438 TaxID=3156880 RepID=UPI0033B5871A